MPPGEHVHIISAGENIHTAYPAIFRTLPAITRTYVLADNSVYELSSNPEVEKARVAIRDAVAAVKEIPVTLSIPLSRELVYQPVYLSVLDTITKIHRECPGARFTFDISGGSKPLSNALFAVSSWLEGDVYSAVDQKTPQYIPLPKRSVRTLLVNPNYQMILAILLRTGKKNANVIPAEWVSRQYIFKQFFTFYVPSRTKKAKPDDPKVQPAKFRKGRMPAAELTHGTFSGFMRALVDASLSMKRFLKRWAARRCSGSRKAVRSHSGSFPILLQIPLSGRCWTKSEPVLAAFFIRVRQKVPANFLQSRSWGVS
ncbi:MAG: hypothetical protein WC620_01025 [Methanoregula sp.]|jgi:hypothetical protein